jgi:hypothetical protein
MVVHNALKAVVAMRGPVVGGDPAPPQPVPATSPTKEALLQKAAGMIVAKAKAAKIVLSVLTIQQAARWVEIQQAQNREPILNGLFGLDLAMPKRKLQQFKQTTGQRATLRTTKTMATTQAPSPGGAIVATRGQYGLVVNGKFSWPTQEAFCELWGATGDAKEAWVRAIPQLLNPAQTTLRVFQSPALAKIQQAAKAYRDSQATRPEQPIPPPQVPDTDTTPGTPTVPLPRTPSPGMPDDYNDFPQLPPLNPAPGEPGGGQVPGGEQTEPEFETQPTTPAPAGGGTDVVTGDSSTNVNVPATEASMFGGAGNMMPILLGAGLLAALVFGKSGSSTTRISTGRGR